MRILQVCPLPKTGVSGIAQHAERLTEQLRISGHTVELRDPADRKSGDRWDLIHLHYVPFAFSGWGLGAIGVTRELAKRAPLVVTLHETRLRYHASPRGLGLAAIQDAVLRRVLHVARSTVIPSGRLRPTIYGRPADVIPSGSVLPLDFHPSRQDRPKRARIGIVGSGHPDRMQDLAVAASVAAAASEEGELVCVGASQVPGFRTTGFLDARELAAELETWDLAVLPYADGVTGRRTSFASVLQAGIPMLTTLTNPMSDFAAAAGFASTDPADREGFIEMAVQLAADTERRRELGKDARTLFDRELSWPVLGERFVSIYKRVAG